MELITLVDKIVTLADEKFEKVLRAGIIPGNLIGKVRISKGEFREEVQKLLANFVSKSSESKIQPSEAPISEVAPETTLTSSNKSIVAENEGNGQQKFDEVRFNELHAQKAYMFHHPNNAEYKTLKALKA